MDHKNFSVLFFFKPPRQAAPVLAALRKTRTEKIEKNFSIFHFYGSAEDRKKIVSIRYITGKLILCVFEGSFLFYGYGQTVTAKARTGEAQGQTESYWQTEKLAHYNTVYIWVFPCCGG
ncbi:hypothetical protein [Enterobacter cloacae complex sp. 370H10]|uniref:hypothetical protein n=1 Tax=Enterobacter cloacae complex sp. 370H10 TaxID=3395877 RepID=UPI003CF64E5E